VLTLVEFGKYIDRNSYPSKQSELLDAINVGLDEAGCSTPLRIAMWLSQVTHETSGFRFFEEQGPPEYFKKYDGRIGNGVGEGYTYRGRGFLQLTGKNNYALAGKALHLDLVHNPDQASTLLVGARIAAWFWTKNDLNTPSDAGDIYTVTRRINGGLNGLDSRIRYYKKAKEVLGIA
jgi:putative chitinase